MTELILTQVEVIYTTIISVETQLLNQFQVEVNPCGQGVGLTLVWTAGVDCYTLWAADSNNTAC